MDATPTSHFAKALKQARLEKRWKQEDLAKKLHVTRRALVSWETGTRIPSPGMVFLLCMLLTDNMDNNVQIADLLQHDLLISYLIDDMQRQTQIHGNEAFRDMADQGIEQLSHLSEGQYQPRQESERLSLLEQTTPQNLLQGEQGQKQFALSSWSDKASATTLQQLFTLFEQLHRHPELIAVAHDFLREMAPA